jgi:transcription initiation factor TFIIIB Brf1 subunit/transcription initiation factor TFIIB
MIGFAVIEQWVCPECHTPNGTTEYEINPVKSLGELRCVSCGVVSNRHQVLSYVRIIDTEGDAHEVL